MEVFPIGEIIKEYKFPFDITDVVDALQMTTRRCESTEWQVDCPFCFGKGGQPDRHGHMTLFLSSNSYKCYRCGRHGGMLKLYSDSTGKSASDSYWDIYHYKLGRCSTYARQRAAPQPLQTLKEEKALASLEIRNQTYTMLLSLLELTKAHRAKLNNRGLPDEEIARLGYKSVPKSGLDDIAGYLARNGCTLEGVPGFYVNDRGQWALNVWGGGIMIPSRSLGGLIQSVQIRKDRADKRGKFLSLTSKDKLKGSKVRYEIHYVNPQSTDTIWLTEGLMKADIAAFLSGDFFVGLLNATSYQLLRGALPVFKSLGVDKAVMCWDMDRYQNNAVMEGLQNCAKIIEGGGIKPIFFDWNPRHKGIDDYRLWECQNGLKKRSVRL